MPINDIVAEVAGEGAKPVSDGDAPEANNAPGPGDDSASTTMRTGPMLPPYLHNQTLDERGGLLLAGSVYGLMGLLKRVTD